MKIRTGGVHPYVTLRRMGWIDRGKWPFRRQSYGGGFIIDMVVRYMNKSHIR